MPRSGALLCLASAAAFGAMGIFGKLAYDEGATVGTLLAARFAIAAALLWVVVARPGRRRADPRAVAPRRRARAWRSAALGYSAQAGAYFAALDRLDASLLSLLVYTFPAIVAVAAIVLGRERLSRRIAVALVLASTGPRAGAGRRRAGALDPLGTALGLTARASSTAPTSSARRASPRASGRSP